MFKVSNLEVNYEIMGDILFEPFWINLLPIDDDYDWVFSLS